MKFATRPAPFQRSKRSVSKIMLELLLALLVVVICSVVYQFTQSPTLGLRALAIVFAALISTYLCDTVTAFLLKKNPWHYMLKNYSYITAIIFALTLPVYTHLYVVVIGSVFATVIGKIVFGGFGQNFGNPAIIGRIAVIAAFGATLGASNVIEEFFTNGTLTGTWVSTSHWLSSKASFGLDQVLIGNYQGALGETFTILLLVIGIYLAIRKVIDYRQPLFYLGTVIIATIMIGVFSKNNMTGMQVDNIFNYVVLHLGLGGLMFGAVFMITDPVTTPTSGQGKIIASIIAGLLTVLIRVKAGATEGVMYSILLVNILTPTIDNFIKGSTIKNITKKWVNIGLFAATGLILVTVSAYHPGAKQPKPNANAVVYKGSASKYTAEYDSKVFIDLEFHLVGGLVENMIYDYTEVHEEDGPHLAGAFKGPLTSGDFYDTYVSLDALKGLDSTALKNLFAPEITSATPGVSGATATAQVYVLAARDAITKMPTIYKGRSVMSDADFHTTVYLDVEIGILDDALASISYDYQEDREGEGNKIPGGFANSLTTGDFYETYVNPDTLIGTSVADLITLFTGVTVTSADPGVSGSTATANAYLNACRQALALIPGGAA